MGMGMGMRMGIPLCFRIAALASTDHALLQSTHRCERTRTSGDFDTSSIPTPRPTPSTPFKQLYIFYSAIPIQRRASLGLCQ
jgi:hypothetical protein